MDLFEISRWASKKGVQLIATGDWQHPLWFKEIQTHLKEVNPGIYTLKRKPPEQKHTVYFFLSSEISSIYSDKGRSRRIHNLVWSPSIQTSERIIAELRARGANLSSDGRPIVGISSKDLLKMILEIDERCMLIPAHVWTPWYGHYGSMSGYDSIEECYGEMSKHIYAVETGLSSDPLMNWQIKELENRSIVSFSDAHSGPKLGREATVFVSKNDEMKVSELKYDDVAAAVKQDPRGRLKIGYTIEFFPEEGKYHWDGHRACGIKYSPKETKEKGTTCPICKKSLTVGVENRVMSLSDTVIDTKTDVIKLQNNVGLTFVYDKDKKRVPFVSMVPLLEILLELNKRSPTKAQAAYDQLTALFGTEFDILLRQPYGEIKKHGGEPLAHAIKMVRERNVSIDPGFDGVFGKVSVLNNNAEKPTETEPTDQSGLF